jgi:hypothetical protein
MLIAGYVQIQQVAQIVSLVIFCQGLIVFFAKLLSQVAFSAILLDALNARTVFI